MCIRDSPTEQPVLEQNVPNPFSEKSIIRYYIPQNTRNASCLLYTSDAADERSSVDLGGRRIIKKKKN